MPGLKAERPLARAQEGLDAIVAVRLRPHGHLAKPDVAQKKGMKRLVHGLLDGESDDGVHPLPTLGEPLNNGELLRAQHPRRDARPVAVGVLKVHADANAMAAGDERHRKVLLVRDAGNEAGRKLGRAMHVWDDGGPSQAKLVEKFPERQPSTNELDLSKTTQRTRIVALIRVQPGEDGRGDGIGCGRQVDTGDQAIRQRDPEGGRERLERQDIDHGAGLSPRRRSRRSNPPPWGYVPAMHSPATERPRRLLPWLALVALALSGVSCAPDPLPLPTVTAVEDQHDRSLDPPLYRALYDYAFLPETQEKEQRVRLLIWLHYMEFNRLQLGLLTELSAQVARERTDVITAQDAIIQKYEPQLDATYDKIWAGLLANAPAAQLDAMAPDLTTVHQREQELLTLRSQSVRTLFDAQAPFLHTLTPTQEIRFTDATFLLRQRLDPYANPGDFNALVGPVYVAGQFGALSKATFDPNEDHLNIGGLWSPEPEKLTGPQYPDARREVLLYMVLLEPSLPEAVAAETARRPKSEIVTPPAPAPPAGNGVPVGPTPAPAAGDGQPTGPVPAAGVPTPVPGAPISAGTPAAPTPGVPIAPLPGKADPTPPPPPK